MKQQNYKNHIFYYWPHHGFLFGAVIVGFILCAVGFWKYEDQRLMWAVMALVIFIILWVGVMTRQHYALGNQNRAVRLELRLRYYILTGKRLEEIESRLSFGQLAALRFAPDEELAGLIDSALAEHLKPDEIKSRIRIWLPDTMRV